MRKLTDEQISRVLSHEAVGLLTHETFARDSDGCGCVAGAAMALAEDHFDGDATAASEQRLAEISNAVGPFSLPAHSFGTISELRKPYIARGPYAVLRMLEKAGLA